MINKLKVFDKKTSKTFDVQMINFINKTIVFNDGTENRISPFSDVDIVTPIYRKDTNNIEIFENDIVNMYSPEFELNKQEVIIKYNPDYACFEYCEIGEKYGTNIMPDDEITIVKGNN